MLDKKILNTIDKELGSYEKLILFAERKNISDRLIAKEYCKTIKEIRNERRKFAEILSVIIMCGHRTKKCGTRRSIEQEKIRAVKRLDKKEYDIAIISGITNLTEERIKEILRK